MRRLVDWSVGRVCDLSLWLRGFLDKPFIVFFNVTSPEVLQRVAAIYVSYTFIFLIALFEAVVRFAKLGRADS